MFPRLIAAPFARPRDIFMAHNYSWNGSSVFSHWARTYDWHRRIQVNSCLKPNLTSLIHLLIFNFFFIFHSKGSVQGKFHRKKKLQKNPKNHKLCFPISQHIRMLSALDTQWVTNSSNGLHAHGHPHWRMVQLETAKLLELGCVLPAVNLPHFQMYRWAFVRSQYDWCTIPGGVVNGDASSMPVFVPHVTRIARLMDLRYTTHSPVRGRHLIQKKSLKFFFEI